MAKTRIIVLQRKKLLTIAIPVAIGLVLLIVMIALSGKKKNASVPPPSAGDSAVQDTPTYRPGVYSSVLSLNDSALNLEVIVDANHINAVRLVNLDEATQAMYPLVEPSINDISAQLAAGTALSDLTLTESSQYTQTLLIDGIRQVLKKAEP